MTSSTPEAWGHLLQKNGLNNLRTCEGFKLVALRNDGEWNLDAAFTNLDKTIQLPYFESWHVGEIIAFSDLKVWGSKTRPFNRCDITGNSQTVNNGLFHVEVWEGKPGTNTVTTENAIDKIGIQESIEKQTLLERQWLSLDGYLICLSYSNHQLWHYSC